MYKVSLESFEGPLDLLLYFIRRDKINIYDIPIAKITKDYVKALDMMKEFNVTVVGEFIVMAATLMRIKAKMLLPSHGNDEDSNVEDPRTVLVQKLLEYQQFKEAAEHLTELSKNQNRYFPRKNATDLPEVHADIEFYLKDISLFEIARCFKIAMDNMPVISTYELRREQINLEEQKAKILGCFDGDGALRFSALMSRFNHKLEIIVSFLAILELIQQGTITVVQNKIFGEIEFHHLENLA